MRLVLASASPRRAELLTSAGFTFETLAVDANERPHPGEAPPEYVRRLAGEKSARGLDLVSSWSRIGEGNRLRPDSALRASSRSRRNASREGGPGDGGPPTSLRQGYGGPPELQRWRKPNAKAEGGHYVQGGDRAQGADCGRGADDIADVVSGLSRTVAGQDIVVLGADTAVVLDGEILGKPRDDENARAMLRRLSGQRHEVLTGVSLRTVGGEVGLVEATSVWFARLTPDAIAWYVSTGEGRDKAGAYAIQGLASRFVPRIEGSYSNVVGLPVAAVTDLLLELNCKYPG